MELSISSLPLYVAKNLSSKLMVLRFASAFHEKTCRYSWSLRETEMRFGDLQDTISSPQRRTIIALKKPLDSGVDRSQEVLITNIAKDSPNVKNSARIFTRELYELLASGLFHSDYRTVSHYWVLLVYVALIRAVWADDGDGPLLL
jgi:hypothetical protein